jgi:hypothetical protein
MMGSMRFLLMVLMGVSSLATAAVKEMTWRQMVSPNQTSFRKILIHEGKIKVSVFLGDDLKISRVFGLAKNFYLIEIQDRNSQKLKAFQVFRFSSPEPIFLHETPLREGSGFKVSQATILFYHDFIDPLDPAPPRSRIESHFRLHKAFLKVNDQRFRKAPRLRGYYQELKYLLDLEDYESYGIKIEFLEKALVEESLFLLGTEQRREALSRVLLLSANLQFMVEKPNQGMAIYQRILKTLPNTPGAWVAETELKRAKRLGHEVYLRLRK